MISEDYYHADGVLKSNGTSLTSLFFKRSFEENPTELLLSTLSSQFNATLKLLGERFVSIDQEPPSVFWASISSIFHALVEKTVAFFPDVDAMLYQYVDDDSLELKEIVRIWSEIKEKESIISNLKANEEYSAQDRHKVHSLYIEIQDLKEDLFRIIDTSEGKGSEIYNQIQVWAKRVVIRLLPDIIKHSRDIYLPGSTKAGGDFIKYFLDIDFSGHISNDQILNLLTENRLNRENLLNHLIRFWTILDGFLETIGFMNSDLDADVKTELMMTILKLYCEDEFTNNPDVIETFRHSIQVRNCSLNNSFCAIDVFSPGVLENRFAQVAQFRILKRLRRENFKFPEGLIQIEREMKSMERAGLIEPQKICQMIWTEWYKLLYSPENRPPSKDRSSRAPMQEVLPQKGFEFREVEIVPGVKMGLSIMNSGSLILPDNPLQIEKILQNTFGTAIKRHLESLLSEGYQFSPDTEPLILICGPDGGIKINFPEGLGLIPYQVELPWTSLMVNGRYISKKMIVLDHHKGNFPSASQQAMELAVATINNEKEVSFQPGWESVIEDLQNNQIVYGILEHYSGIDPDWLVSILIPNLASCERGRTWLKQNPAITGIVSVLNEVDVAGGALENSHPPIKYIDLKRKNRLEKVTDNRLESMWALCFHLLVVNLSAPILTRLTLHKSDLKAPDFDPGEMLKNSTTIFTKFVEYIQKKYGSQNPQELVVYGSKTWEEFNNSDCQHPGVLESDPVGLFYEEFLSIMEDSNVRAPIANPEDLKFITRNLNFADPKLSQDFDDYDEFSRKVLIFLSRQTEFWQELRTHDHVIPSRVISESILASFNLICEFDHQKRLPESHLKQVQIGQSYFSLYLNFSPHEQSSFRAQLLQLAGDNPMILLSYRGELDIVDSRGKPAENWSLIALGKGSKTQEGLHWHKLFQESLNFLTSLCWMELPSVIEVTNRQNHEVRKKRTVKSHFQGGLTGGTRQEGGPPFEFVYDMVDLFVKSVTNLANSRETVLNLGSSEIIQEMFKMPEFYSFIDKIKN